MVKATLREKNKARCVLLPDFKLYFKRAIVIKTIWYRREDRQTDQSNRTDSKEINPQI